MKRAFAIHRILQLALFIIFACYIQVATALELLVPAPKGASGQHKIDLLNLIVKHSSHPITITQKETSNRLQEISMLESQQLNVMWAPKSKDLQSQMLAIQVPLDKEIVGSVALIVRESEIAKFKGIGSLHELKSLYAGVRRDTVTRKILEGNSFNFVSTLRGNYGHMLDGERFDYFPVAASNAYSLARSWSQKDNLSLAVQPDLLLKLPLNSYFYVEKGNTELAEILKEALLKAIESGDFDALLKASPGYQSAQKFFENKTLRVMEVTAEI